ncbi:MAG: hypothetical protein RDU20_19315 [Desulfomonilaceae bacterium]|nr:hypothetical protein [Desulfomonilaceae bacterium]
MRSQRSMKHSIQLVFFAILVAMPQLQLSNALAAAEEPASAVVEAVQGTAYLVGPEEADQRPLAKGDTIPAWNTLNTEDNGKLLLEWEGDVFASVGADSTLFVSTREAQEGTIVDVQLIRGILRAGSFGEEEEPARPYALTTPVAAVEPAESNTEADFIAEVYEPAVTVVTVLKGTVRVKNLSTEGSDELLVQSCRSVIVEEGKPFSDVTAVPAEVIAKLVADTTIEGTELAEVQVCGLGKVAREPLPAPSAPPDYYYVEDDDVDYYYPYDEIEVYPPTVAAGPMIIVLPGIGRWYLPYDVYHTWGFGPDLIRLYVSVVLARNALYYDTYYWNRLAVMRREYYDVLYPAQLARNTMLIAQAQNRLDFVRIRRNLLERRMQNLQARVSGLERALSGRGAVRAGVFDALYGSLNSPRNIGVARSFRQGIEGRWKIQEQLAGRASEELAGLRGRAARARNPQERLQLRDQMMQVRNVINEGRLPLPAKDKDIGNLLDQVRKTRDPGQLNTLQDQLAQRLGRPKVLEETGVLDPKRLERLARGMERTATPEARRHGERRLQALQKNVRQRMEIESAQKEIDRVVSRAVQTKDEAGRAELLRTVPELVKPGREPLKGSLGALREQQQLYGRIIGRPDRGKEDETIRRLRDFTKKQADMVRPRVDSPSEDFRRRVPGRPTADEAAKKRAQDLKKRADDARRSAEQMLQRREPEPRRIDTQRGPERDRPAMEPRERGRQAEDALRREQEKGTQAERSRSRAVERERSQQQERQQRLQLEQRRKAEESARERQMQEQSRKQAEQDRTRELERSKAQQRQQQMRGQQERLQLEQRRKAEEGARERRIQEQSRKQAEQDRTRESERSKAQQRQQQMQEQQQRQQQMQEQQQRQQQMREQQQRQQQMREQQERQQQMRGQQERQQQMREQQQRQQQMRGQQERQQQMRGQQERQQQMREQQQRQIQQQRMPQMQRPEPRGMQQQMQDRGMRGAPGQAGPPGLPGQLPGPPGR